MATWGLGAHLGNLEGNLEGKFEGNLLGNLEGNLEGNLGIPFCAGLYMGPIVSSIRDFFQLISTIVFQTGLRESSLMGLTISWIQSQTLRNEKPRKLKGAAWVRERVQERDLGTNVQGCDLGTKLRRV